MTVWTFFCGAVAIAALLLFIYIAARLVFTAFFRSKEDHNSRSKQNG